LVQLAKILDTRGAASLGRCVSRKLGFPAIQWKAREPQMHVSRIHRIIDLREPWKELSQGRPFCSPNWMQSWATKCCSNGSPFVVAVFDRDRVVGIAPLHTHKSRIGAERLEFLGTGKACSEYLGILADPQNLEPVLDHLAGWMMESAGGLHGEENRWQRLDLESVARDDVASTRLCHKLAARGAQWTEGEAAACWRIDLCETQAEWLGRLHKSVRRKLCLLQTKAIASGRAIYKIATTRQERLANFAHLVRLHNARRKQLGEIGCFEFPGFLDFMNEVISDPESGDPVKVSVVELDGVVVAAGLCFESTDSLLVYQSGISLPPKPGSDVAVANPGWLLNFFHIGYARQRRLQFIDFLRGDEKYKRHLGAVPAPVRFHMVVPPFNSAVVRQRIWAAAQAAKCFSKDVIPPLHRLTVRRHWPFAGPTH